MEAISTTFPNCSSDGPVEYVFSNSVPGEDFHPCDPHHFSVFQVFRSPEMPFFAHLFTSMLTILLVTASKWIC